MSDRYVRYVRYVTLKALYADMESTCDAWGQRGATYNGAHGLHQHVALHPHITLASVQCLMCSLRRNSAVASLQMPDQHGVALVDVGRRHGEGWSVGRDRG